MSVATQIQRIQSAKGTIKSAIEAKGVTVPSGATLDTYGTYIRSIETGGSGGNYEQQFIDMIENDATKSVSVTIPDSVKSIGTYVFYNRNYIKSVTIPDSVTSIGNSAFQGCTSLTSITIPSSVTSIGNSAFQGCTSLTSITIPNSVTSIGFRAFQGCTSLTSVTIGNGVTSIGSGVFSGCTALETITVDSANTVYDSRNNCNAIIETNTNTLMYGCKNSTIPNTVTAIGDYAFGDYTDITNITIPNSVTSIGNSSFRGCSGLTNITIPSTVTSIGSNAFYNCSGLTSINIPDNVTSIGSTAFIYCTRLTEITVKAATPPTLGSNVFDSTNNCPIYVPSGSVSAYKTASGWSSYASRIQAIPTV